MKIVYYLLPLLALLCDVHGESLKACVYFAYQHSKKRDMDVEGYISPATTMSCTPLGDLVGVRQGSPSRASCDYRLPHSSLNTTLAWP